MNPSDKSQMTLPISSALGDPVAVVELEKRGDLPYLGFSLTLDEWLDFLADEWWVDSRDKKTVRMGVGKSHHIKSDASDVFITAWVAISSLPSADVLIVRSNSWRNASISTIEKSDDGVVWLGPIPLRTVSTFSVANEKILKHVLAVSKGFGSFQLPDIPFVVRSMNAIQFSEVPEARDLVQLPDFYDSIRGGAAMAVWAVPAIGPWLDLLCETFSDSKHGDISDYLEVPWWSFVPWAKEKYNGGANPLWVSMVELFKSINIREEWRPKVALNSILNRARELGAQAKYCDDLQIETIDLLSDRMIVDVSKGESDPLGLMLQLILLRPHPDRFVTWKNDLQALTPAVWWSGALLSGLICGYRNLDYRYKGGQHLRDFLAVKTVEADMSVKKSAIWAPFSSAPVGHKRVNGKVIISFGDQVVLERLESSRGKWFHLDLADENNLKSATCLAADFFPGCLKKILVLKDVDIMLEGAGEIALDKGHNVLTVRGELSLNLDRQVEFVDKLDIDMFRAWILKGAVKWRLPSPLPVSVHKVEEVFSSFAAINPSAAPIGLKVVSDFISEKEEFELMAAVEENEWLGTLSRRVQHYGWRYDYRARSIDASSYLGELPLWAKDIAIRLYESGLVAELPDQVIVNEYVGSQGISKHVDCRDCFRGSIVTISLLETWSMIFRNRMGLKYELALPRRSAVIMSDDSRDKWTHEIPKRLKETFGRRNKRISLTFRKVNV